MTRLVALVAATVVLSIGAGGATAAAADAPVGHTVKLVEVEGSAQRESRKVEVDVWYPADPATASARPKAIYKSALHGKDAVSRSLGSAVVDGRGRDRPRGRGDRSRRRAVPGDRVLPRLDERADRLRVDARADRGRRLRRGRPWPHQQHARRPRSSTSSTGRPRRRRCRARRCSRATTRDPARAPGRASR